MKIFPNCQISLVDSLPKGTTDESVVCLIKTAVTQEMKLHPTPFEMIKSGQKTVELRLFDEKRQRLKVGDTIVFTNTATGEALSKTVAQLHRFDSFEALYRSLDLLQCGYTPETVAAAKSADMLQYYSAQEQAQYGVVGIALR